MGSLFLRLTVGLRFGLASGLAAALVVGLAATPPDLTTASGPGTVLARDRAPFWVVGLAGGLAVGLAGPAFNAPAGGLANWLAGIGWFSYFQATWGSFTIARCWLALHGRLPWRLMSFLADAHEERGVLRQVGAVYQFRHADLQRRLATRP